MTKSVDINDQLTKLRHQYCAQLADRLRRIGTLINSANAYDELVELHRELHSLSGSGATYGFPAVSETARAAEKIVRDILDEKSCMDKSTKDHLSDRMAALHGAASDAISVNYNIELPTKSQKPSISSVALLESSPDIANTLKKQLSAYGLTVTHFSKLVDFSSAKSKFDCIVSALYLAEDDVTNHFRKHPENTDIFVYAARNDFASALNAVRAGVTRIFESPLDTGALIDHMLNRTDTGRGEPFRILMVDDSQDMLAYHAAWLEAAGMVVSKVDDPLRLFDLLSETNPDVLILDMYMPQCSGFEVARVLRMRDEFLSLPIMFLSVESDLSRQGQALSAGGDDFFTKPVQPNAFIAAVATRARRARALKAQMVHDGLTGLFNHTSIETALHQEVTRAARGGETIVASMVDIDLFKRVNDTYGHAAGDDVLRALSRLLRHRLRKTDVIGRYGGEEFLIILPGTTLEKAGHVIDELREGFSQLVHQCGDRLFSCTFSAGVAKLCMGESAAEMLKRADDALYKSKNGGRNRITLASDSAPN